MCETIIDNSGDDSSGDFAVNHLFLCVLEGAPSRISSLSLSSSPVSSTDWFPAVPRVYRRVLSWTTLPGACWGRGALSKMAIGGLSGWISPKIFGDHLLVPPLLYWWGPGLNKLSTCFWSMPSAEVCRLSGVCGPSFCPLG